MPHRHPSFLRQHRASVPQSASHRSSPPRRYASGCEPPISTARNLTVRADRPHSHPSAMTASPIASLKTHTAFLHGHAGLPQLIIAPTSHAATHGCRESVAHDMTQPCTTFRVAPCLYGAYRSTRHTPLRCSWRTFHSLDVMLHSWRQTTRDHSAACREVFDALTDWYERVFHSQSRCLRS